MSFTVLPMVPILSSDEAKAINPYLDTVPYEGQKPTTSHNDAG